MDLTINTDLATTILTGFIRSEVRRAGFERAVIGLSGGIDSTLSCVLAAQALGAQNVIAIRLPYRTSAPDSLEHAQLIIDQYKLASETIDITPVVEPLFDRDPGMTKERKGNMMARARMLILYDQSQLHKGLVIGTSNKTELLLGYTTLWGDMASALNPIGDLYKTQVRQLSRALGIPEVIVSKPPSADLWISQTDEGELGFTYDEVDKLLLLLVDRRYRPQECIEAGFDAKFVNDVLERIRRSQFKRMLPLIAKLSNRTIGYDFLYLRDWGT
jgi:NAD+ synthase